MAASLFGQIVKVGTFLYDGSVVCDVRIIFSRTRFGTGDYEDPESIREDKEIDTYYVEYGSTRDRGVFVARSGCFDSLSDAETKLAKTAGVGDTLRWNDG